MRICYVPSDMDAPGCYRCLFPGRQISAQTEHETILPPYELIADPSGKRRFNFTVSFNPAEPKAHVWVFQSRFDRLVAEDGVQHLRANGVATVMDLDDNYEELPAWNPAFAGTHPYRRDDGVIINRDARRRMKKQLGYKVPPNKTNRLWLKEVMKQVDKVTVSTPYLAELYSKYHNDITVVRNYVDWDMWEDITPQYEVEREGRIRIGYQGVFRFRQGDLAILRPIIEPFLKRHSNVDFVANHEDVHNFLGIPEDRRVTVGEYDFLNIDTGEYAMPERTATMDIGLVPLTPGGLSEAKSHLKGMEYNAAGIPFVASNTESYRWYLGEAEKAKAFWKGDAVTIAHNQTEWVEKLDALVRYEESRRSGGMNGRVLAQQLSIQKNYGKWVDVYEELIGDRYKQFSRGAIQVGAVQKLSELSATLKMVDEIKPKTVVEVGSAAGRHVLGARTGRHPDALMISIDMPSGSPLDVRGGKDVYGGRDRSATSGT
jgi:glycosyltransferase involved in cell wall biosynthesis